MHNRSDRASQFEMLPCRMMIACLTTTFRSESTYLSRWEQCRLPACLPGQLWCVFCTAYCSQMKRFLLAAKLQLLHDVGLTTASAAWLLFRKLQPREPNHSAQPGHD